MPTLADQVREMLRILEVVDPQAAARIKGQSAAPVAYAPVIMPAPAQVAPFSEPVVSPVVQTQPSQPELPFLRDLTTERLVEGLIWSEILSKPVSKRRQRRM